jgi:2-amino-4-hydroxy-6-hydroxymethyldihydropteridine diphosphokinase
MSSEISARQPAAAASPGAAPPGHDPAAGLPILLALGSNLGDRAAALADALRRLEAAGVRVLSASSVHETPALMPEGAPPEWDRPYLNQVVMVHTDLDPRALLRCTQGIEQAMGRRPAARWAPRVIDIDLLAVGAAVLDTPELTLPHPRLHERRFVLAPLCEIAPGWVHPRLGVAATQLLAGLPDAATSAAKAG